MAFKDNLKKLRKAKGITQKRLASEIYVSRTLITKYETGVVYPTDYNLDRLASFFGINRNELVLN